MLKGTVSGRRARRCRWTRGPDVMRRGREHGEIVVGHSRCVACNHSTFLGFAFESYYVTLEYAGMCSNCSVQNMVVQWN